MNNVLGLAAAVSPMGRGDVGFVDTGEPTSANSAAGTVVKTITFPVNGVGVQPQVTRGGWALVIKAVNAGTTVGAVTIAATDGTIIEQLNGFPAIATAGQGCCYAEGFTSSIAAGTDKGAITNVVSLTATVVVTAGTGATILFAAVGGP
jgi:hypothetical protein